MLETSKVLERERMTQITHETVNAPPERMSQNMLETFKALERDRTAQNTLETFNAPPERMTQNTFKTLRLWGASA